MAPSQTLGAAQKYGNVVVNYYTIHEVYDTFDMFCKTYIYTKHLEIITYH